MNIKHNITIGEDWANYRKSGFSKVIGDIKITPCFKMWNSQNIILYEVILDNEFLPKIRAIITKGCKEFSIVKEFIDDDPRKDSNTLVGIILNAVAKDGDLIKLFKWMQYKAKEEGKREIQEEMRELLGIYKEK